MPTSDSRHAPKRRNCHVLGRYRLQVIQVTARLAAVLFVSCCFTPRFILWMGESCDGNILHLDDCTTYSLLHIRIYITYTTHSGAFMFCPTYAKSNRFIPFDVEIESELNLLPFIQKLTTFSINFITILLQSTTYSHLKHKSYAFISYSTL